MSAEGMSEFTEKTSAAIKDLLFRMADDELIIGHRNSEWTGLGPILEEDIAFSSIAQDQIGHALAIYTLLQTHFGEPTPDAIAFGRSEREFHSCQFVELPGMTGKSGGYDFSLVRQFLFDHAEACRFELLTRSTFAPLAGLAKKIKGELKYHVLHGDLWVEKLGKGTEESHARMQSALSEAFSCALGIFEPGIDEAELIQSGVFGGESVLLAAWLAKITPVVGRAGLTLPDLSKAELKIGGRKGYHTEFLQPLLDEMSEVYRLDPAATW
jgi:ring-1,2-phenylacetyl-CoA epoxidase subunit PaaC